MADRYGLLFRRVLDSAERFSERATCRGFRFLNTPCSRSNASLRLVTSLDHRRLPGVFFVGGRLRAGLIGSSYRLIAGSSDPSQARTYSVVYTGGSVARYRSRRCCSVAFTERNCMPNVGLFDQRTAATSMTTGETSFGSESRKTNRCVSCVGTSLSILHPPPERLRTIPAPLTSPINDTGK